MRVGPTVNDVQLTGLLPNTEYEVTVQAVLHDLTSEPAKAQEVTCKMLLAFFFLVLLLLKLTFVGIFSCDVSESLMINA